MAATRTFFTEHDLVGEVARAPEARGALERLGVNHCCGAHLTLAAAAAAAGLPVDELLDAVNGASGGSR